MCDLYEPAFNGMSFNASVQVRTSLLLLASWNASLFISKAVIPFKRATRFYKIIPFLEVNIGRARIDIVFHKFQ